MGEFHKPDTEFDFARNFAQIKPLMNETQAYYESSRCLFCYDAPCVNACPTGIDIPLFIRQIHSNNINGAARTIYESNYFGYACGKVCPTEVLCEGACVYNHQDVKPIEIGRLQSFATGKAMASNEKLFNLPSPNGKRVACVGAGPAGISAACELRMLGYEVDIYEAKSHPSGLTIYGVAPYKISNEEALEEMDYLQQQFGFTIKYNHPIRSEADILRLESFYDAVLLGIGLGKTRKIGLPGENLPNCVGAVEFIERLRMNHVRTKVGKRVVVIGGGNTAMDAASEVCRMGSEATLVYRRGQEEMSAYVFELELARRTGAHTLFYAAPVEIMGTKKVEGVKFIRTRMADGKLKTVTGSEFVIPCDMVIRATGQEKQSGFLKLIQGIELDEKGRIRVNDRFQTTNPRFFAAGDAVNGGVEVVNAVAEARIAANGLHRYLAEVGNESQNES
jgi:glutamate synthase (NADPH/NADH) small chain